MDVERNAPCPCGSGTKFKRCCLDELTDWRRTGRGLVATYVELPDGRRVALHEWNGPLRDDTPLVAELNPVTAAWVRNMLPDGASYTDPAYRTLLLDHLAAIAGPSLSATLAADADQFQPQM